VSFDKEYVENHLLNLFYHYQYYICALRTSYNCQSESDSETLCKTLTLHCRNYWKNVWLKLFLSQNHWKTMQRKGGTFSGQCLEISELNWKDSHFKYYKFPPFILLAIPDQTSGLQCINFQNAYYICLTFYPQSIINWWKHRNLVHFIMINVTLHRRWK
jgi:hypothetical protein